MRVERLSMWPDKYSVYTYVFGDFILALWIAPFGSSLGGLFGCFFGSFWMSFYEYRVLGSFETKRFKKLKIKKKRKKFCIFAIEEEEKMKQILIKKGKIWIN